MDWAYKDILVHLDNSSRSDVRLNIALELAARDGAHLAAFYATRLPSLAMFMGDASVYDMRMADEILRQGREYEQESTRTMENRFEEVCRKYSVEGEFRRFEGPSREKASRRTRTMPIWSLSDRMIRIIRQRPANRPSLRSPSWKPVGRYW